jgi:translation initiation factor IF-2
MPVNVTGLDTAPDAGDPFYVLNDLVQAREIAVRRAAQQRTASLAGHTPRVSFEEFQRRLAVGRLDGERDLAELNLILRADARGSLEAIEHELAKLAHPEVRINILQATVGAVTTSDVTLAGASDAVIAGFNVTTDEAARVLAEQWGVEIRRYDVIYHLTDDIKAMLAGRLKPDQRTVELGRALVQQLFRISGIGTVAGCRVAAGVIERGCRVRVHRDGRILGDYALESLKRGKDDAKQVREGLECGMKLAKFDDLKEGDTLEAYKIEQVARTL